MLRGSGSRAKIVTVALLDEEGRVLVVRRGPPGEETRAGEWECPGGHRDPVESERQAGMREVAEEVGLGVRFLPGRAEFPLGSGDHGVMLLGLASGRVRLGAGHDRYAWAALGDLGRFQPVPSGFVEQVRGLVGTRGGGEMADREPEIYGADQRQPCGGEAVGVPRWRSVQESGVRAPDLVNIAEPREGADFVKLMELVVGHQIGGNEWGIPLEPTVLDVMRHSELAEDTGCQGSEIGRDSEGRVLLRVRGLEAARKVAGVLEEAGLRVWAGGEGAAGLTKSPDGEYLVRGKGGRYRARSARVARRLQRELSWRVAAPMGVGGNPALQPKLSLDVQMPTPQQTQQAVTKALPGSQVHAQPSGHLKIDGMAPQQAQQATQKLTRALTPPAATTPVPGQQALPAPGGMVASREDAMRAVAALRREYRDERWFVGVRVSSRVGCGCGAQMGVTPEFHDDHHQVPGLLHGAPVMVVVVRRPSGDNSPHGARAEHLDELARLLGHGDEHGVAGEVRGDRLSTRKASGKSTRRRVAAVEAVDPGLEGLRRRFLSLCSRVAHLPGDQAWGEVKYALDTEFGGLGAIDERSFHGEFSRLRRSN